VARDKNRAAFASPDLQPLTSYPQLLFLSWQSRNKTARGQSYRSSIWLRWLAPYEPAVRW